MTLAFNHYSQMDKQPLNKVTTKIILFLYLLLFLIVKRIKRIIFDSVAPCQLLECQRYKF